MNQKLVLSRVWRKQLVSRESIRNLLFDAQLTLVGEWGAQPELAELTLARIVKTAVQRQQRQLARRKPVTKKEYDGVSAASRRLKKLLLALQDRDDPPPILDEFRTGRTLFEDWAHIGKELLWETRGADANSDPETMHALIAFYELAACTRPVRFSRNEEDPMRSFVASGFKLARQVLVIAWSAGEASPAHTLNEPNTETFVKARNQAHLRTAARAQVTKAFLKFRSLPAPVAARVEEKSKP